MALFLQASVVLRTTELFKTACALQMNHIYSLEIHTVENEALLRLWNRDTACTVHKGSLWKPFSANEKILGIKMSNQGLQNFNLLAKTQGLSKNCETPNKEL